MLDVGIVPVDRAGSRANDAGLLYFQPPLFTTQTPLPTAVDRFLPPIFNEFCSSITSTITMHRQLLKEQPTYGASTDSMLFQLLPCTNYQLT
jgi:glucan phosphorylase